MPDRALGVHVSGGHAYVASSGRGSDKYGGLRVIDISTPSNPREVGFYNTPGEAYRVYVLDGIAYVADGHSGLRVIDVSTPSNPREVGSYCYNCPSDRIWAAGVHVSDGLAYVAVRSGGLWVVDVSIPSDPRGAGFYDPHFGAEAVYESGGYIYVASDLDGLLILKLTQR